MFDEMIAGIQQDTVRTAVSHIRIEQKVEREQVAEVTGTNKDDIRQRHRYSRAETESLSERSMPVRKRQEIQTVLRKKTGIKKM